MQQTAEYSVSINALCVFEAIRTESEEECLTICTLPETPTNLILESRNPNNFTVKWDSTSASLVNHRYRLTIESPVLAYSAEYFIGGDRNAFNFSKLPEILGTGM